MLFLKPVPVKRVRLTTAKECTACWAQSLCEIYENLVGSAKVLV